MIPIFQLFLLQNLFYLFNSANSECNGVQLSYDKITYCLSITSTDFNNAEVVCNNYGLSKGKESDGLGHLVAIHNAFLNNFLVKQIVKYNISNVWIGAQSGEEWAGYYGFLEWNDGSDIDYDNFGYAQSNSWKKTSYLQLNATDGKWYPTNDESLQIPFICEQPLNKK